MIGKKIGVTSQAVQDMLNVRQPDFGFLTDAMEVADGATVEIAKGLIQPRAEAEIAFILKSDLRGPGIGRQHVLEATEFIAPCFEIVDSRIADWKINIVDTVADNASCGVFVLGDARADPRDFDLAALKVTVQKNGAPAQRRLRRGCPGFSLGSGRVACQYARPLRRYAAGGRYRFVGIAGAVGACASRR